MIFRLVLIINLLLSFTIFSCTNNSENSKKQIIEFVDSIGNQIAKVTKPTIWKYRISDSNGLLQLNIESDQKSGIDYLKMKLKHEFPDLEIKASLKSKIRAQELTFGLINISAGNIRKSPRHTSELVTQELMGTPVKVLKVDEDWFLVQTPNGYSGWIDAPAVSLRTGYDMKNLSKQTFGIFTNQYGQIYKSIGKDEIVSDIVLGNIIKVTENLADFYAVSLPDGRKGYIEKEGLINFRSIFNQSKVDTDYMVTLAKTFMGVSYLWGGKSSKAIDCSGLTSILYFFSGIILQRDASQQIKYGELVDTDNNFSKLKTGDLLFFGQKATNNSPEKVIHVGLYLGKGEFIHASGFVRISNINNITINSANSNEHVFLRAKRIINSVGLNGIQKIEDNELFKYFYE